MHRLTQPVPARQECDLHLAQASTLPLYSLCLRQLCTATSLAGCRFARGEHDFYADEHEGDTEEARAHAHKEEEAIDAGELPGWLFVQGSRPPQSLHRALVTAHV